MSFAVRMRSSTRVCARCRASRCASCPNANFTPLFVALGAATDPTAPVVTAARPSPEPTFPSSSTPRSSSVAALYADFDRAVADGEHLVGDDLERLIGRKPTPLAEAVAAVVAGPQA